ncbi:MAG: redoxin domain-containing protein [Sedimentisphaerales bacterium]|nr:redoxin domain-containing protein [Sedimentisphaerales bacterium]
MKLAQVAFSGLVLLGFGVCTQGDQSSGSWNLSMPTRNVVALSPAEGVDAAALVQCIREGEAWIHDVDTLRLRMESTWSRAVTPQAPGQLPPVESCNCAGGASHNATLKVVSRGILEYAIDRNRLRFLDDQPGRARTLKIWDGRQLIVHETPARGRENYFLDYTPQDNLVDILASKTSWPRSQPHSFWWDVKDVDELSAYYGRPSEFQCAGRADYRDVACHVLELYPTEVRAVLHGRSYRCDAGLNDHQEHGFIGEVRGLADQSCRWYVGTEDKLLHGVVWSVSGRPRLEHWMLDYRQVATDCWYPMTQGYQIYEKNSDGLAYIDSRRDLKVLQIEVDTPLPSEMFRLELKEGVRVRDRRKGYLVTYEYRPKPPRLLGKPLPSLEASFSLTERATVAGKPVLLCFWDVNQRPSRHCIRNLAKQAPHLQKAGITLVAVHAGDAEPAALSRWIEESEIPFPCATITRNVKETRFAWNVRSLPWLVLANQDHVVKATGFGLPDLGRTIADVLEQPEQWARVSP